MMQQGWNSKRADAPLGDTPTTDATGGATNTETATRGFARLAWFTLVWNILVIALGTLLRATGSGDGCGDHWPDCNGTLIPITGRAATFLEFSHRLSTGVDGLLVLALVGWGVVKYRRHSNRVGLFVPLALTLLMTLAEALIGRHLVKHGLVTTNASVERAVWMSIHLVSTFVLLGGLALTAWWASSRPALRLHGQGSTGGAIAAAFIVTLLLGVSGAVTALGDTLYPVRDHADAVLQSLAPGAHFLVKLRLLHPYIAGSVGLYLVLVAGLLAYLRPSSLTVRYARLTAALFVAELALGGINVWLRAPVWMQLVHLLFADLTWLTLVFLAASALAVDVPQVERVIFAPPVVPEPSLASVGSGSGPVTWRDYLRLTKPRIISLLLATTLPTMFIAQSSEHRVTLWLFVVVALGGYMASGSAKVFNMVIDREMDSQMRRTAQRDTVTNRISAENALRFGFALAAGSFALLWWGANPVAALLALAGLVFYVVIYTIVLKQRTWQNIVIGGIAGAFPPLVGWASVTGGLSPLAWYLFALIIVWTPAHFWALAILLKDDYADAGVPMLPVVRGDRFTAIQIGLYAVLTALVSLLPLVQGLVGYGYVGVALVLNAVLIGMSIRLYRLTERPRAAALFHYSMAYLALLFLTMAIDHSLWHSA